MSQEQRDDLFAQLASKYEQVVAREVMEPIEVEVLADEAGNNAIWHIKEPPGWAQAAYHNIADENQVLYATTVMAVCAHDMFGSPIFYDNEGSVTARLAQINRSRDQLATLIPTSGIADIYERVMSARVKISADRPTPEDVKNDSSKETDT